MIPAELLVMEKTDSATGKPVALSQCAPLPELYITPLGEAPAIATTMSLTELKTIDWTPPWSSRRVVSPTPTCVHAPDPPDDLNRPALVAA